MSSVSGGGGNYISDASIMEWLALQQDRIYGDLKESMDLADDRAAFTDKLSTIKSGLERANSSHDFAQVDQDLQELKQLYGSDPRFQEAFEGLDDLANRIHGDRQKGVQYAIDKAAYDAQQVEFSAANDPMGLKYAQALIEGRVLSEPIPPAPQSYTEAEMQSFEDLITGKTDSAGKNDQLTMIHIQELKATLDQGSQLASTFISSGDKTQSAIINNIA